MRRPRNPSLCAWPRRPSLELRARVTRLRQLTELRTTQLNQQRLVTNRAVQAGFRKMLAFVAKQIQELEKSIAALIDADPLWRELDQAFRTIKEWPIARWPASWRNAGDRHAVQQDHFQTGRCGPAGPRLRQTPGQTRCPRRRAAVREILFIVASVVGRHEPDFVAFQKRLRDAGKPPKVIRIALAHKLLVRLNAKAREVRQRLAILDPTASPLLAAY